MFNPLIVNFNLYLLGRGLAEKLVKEGIETTYILLTALTQVLSAVTKVLEAGSLE